MPQKKWLKTVVALFLSVGMLAACGNNEPNEDDNGDTEMQNQEDSNTDDTESEDDSTNDEDEDNDEDDSEEDD